MLLPLVHVGASYVAVVTRRRSRWLADGLCPVPSRQYIPEPTVRGAQSAIAHEATEYAPRLVVIFECGHDRR